MKVNSTVYKGIEYVQVNSLPGDQKEKLLQTINHDLFIKILVDEKLIGNCLLFKDYEVWFDNIFKSQTRGTLKTNLDNVESSSVQIESVKKS